MRHLTVQPTGKVSTEGPGRQDRASAGHTGCPPAASASRPAAFPSRRAAAARDDGGSITFCEGGREMSKCLTGAVVLALAAIAGPARAQTAPPTGQKITLSANLLRGNTSIQRDLLEAAEKMPEGDYQFKPTPETRPFGQLVAHIALSQFGGCAALKGETNPKAGEKEETQRSKAEYRRAAQGIGRVLRAGVRHHHRGQRPWAGQGADQRGGAGALPRRQQLARERDVRDDGGLPPPQGAGAADDRATERRAEEIERPVALR